MSLHSAAQNAVLNAGAGLSANSAMNAYSNSIVQTNGTTGTWLGQPIQPIITEGQHTFHCHKVENGWVLNYRNKQYISADLDSLMDQMKAAMVIDRIDK